MGNSQNSSYCHHLADSTARQPAGYSVSVDRVESNCCPTIGKRTTHTAPEM